MVKNNITLNLKNSQILIQDKPVPLVSEPKLTQINARLGRKIIIPPNSHTYALVKCDQPIHNQCNFLFTPNITNFKIECQPSIHTNSKPLKLTHSELLTNNEHTPLETHNSQSPQFHVFIRNLSSSTMHFNKNQIIGQVSSNVEISQEPEVEEEHINLIQASPQVLEQRKIDLSPSDFKLTHLFHYQQQTLTQILLSNYAAFSKSLQTLGCTDKIVPKIEFIHKHPIRTLPFPIPHALQEEAKTQIEELQAAGLIEKNVTEWACPMLLVKKKSLDSKQPPKYRLALDLRLLNSIINFSSYPLPKISTIINNISQFKFFSVLDLKNAYWQIKLPEEYQDILSFTTPWGTFRNKRLVFGLKTAASTFQALMDTILDELQLPGVFAYQDDILLCSNSFDESTSKLNAILQALVKCNITLSPDKCSFHKTEIDYLGFHITHGKILPIKSNIIKITSFPRPKTKRQVKQFLGVCGYYRHLIPSYAQLTQPLIDVTKPNSKFYWSESLAHSFKQLQSIFFSAPFVRLPDWNKEFILNTDASKLAISAVLMQDFEGQLLPISYFSKSLSPAEERYPAIKLELMAIAKGITAFKQYLYNTHFTILSDSKPLKHYKKVSSPSDITTRWLLELSEYSFTFKHIQGKLNILADFLSRIPGTLPHEDISTNPEILVQQEIYPTIEIDSENTTPVLESEETYNLVHFTNQAPQDNLLLPGINTLPSQREKGIVNALASTQGKPDPLLEITNNTFVQEQLKDESTSEIYNALLNTKRRKTQHNNFFIHPGTKVLMYNVTKKNNTNFNPNSPSHKIVVPTSLRAKALSICHLSHQGLHKTYEIVADKYYWHGIYADTLNFVYSCTKCIQNKPYPTQAAPFGSNWIPSAPGEFISMDIVGPLPNGHHVLTIIDHFSRHVQLYALYSISTNTVTKSLFEYIATFGRPAMILTDLGTQFTSEVFESFNKTLGIKLAHTSSGRPQANAISERINTSIKSTIISLQQEGHSFQQALKIHQHMYNNSIHSSTGYTPNLLHFGRNLSLFFDTFTPSVEFVQLDKTQYLNSLLKSLNDVYTQTYSNLERNQIRQNTIQHEKAKIRHLKIKDIVYLRSKDKFKPKYSGPYSVIQKTNDVNYIIQALDNPAASTFKVHVDRLRSAPPRRDHLQPQSTRTQPVNCTPHHPYQLRPRRGI